MRPDIQINTFLPYSDFVEKMMMTEGQFRLAENALGLTGEAGEVAEKIKKVFRDGTYDAAGVQKELGDVIFYWIALHNALGLNPVDTININVDKLTSRKQSGTLSGEGDNR